MLGKKNPLWIWAVPHYLGWFKYTQLQEGEISFSLYQGKALSIAAYDIPSETYGDVAFVLSLLSLSKVRCSRYSGIGRKLITGWDCLLRVSAAACTCLTVPDELWVQNDRVWIFVCCSCYVLIRITMSSFRLGHDFKRATTELERRRRKLITEIVTCGRCHA